MLPGDPTVSARPPVSQLIVSKESAVDGVRDDEGDGVPRLLPLSLRLGRPVMSLISASRRLAATSFDDAPAESMALSGEPPQLAEL